MEPSRSTASNVEITAFGGGARLQQAMAADSIDLGLGSGPEMAYIEKGAPVNSVAMVVGPPVYLVLLVRPDSPIKTVSDLKGRKINVSSVRSLTGWLVGELSRQQGWGPRGVDLVYVLAQPHRDRRHEDRPDRRYDDRHDLCAAGRTEP